MKRFLVLGLATMISCSALAAPLSKGVYEARVDLTYDLMYNGRDRNIPAMLGLGYYVTDCIVAGGYLYFSKKTRDSFWGVDDVWGLGAFGEYHFLVDNAWIPFAGVTAGILDGDEASGDTVLVITPNGGIKYFFNEIIGVAAQLNLHWATDEIYDFDRNMAITTKVKGDGKLLDISGNVSLRVLLW